MATPLKHLTIPALTLATLLSTSALSTDAMAAPTPPPATTVNGQTTQTGLASDAFVGLRGFLNLPAAQRNQIDVYYAVRVKNADLSDLHATLTDQGKTTTLRVMPDGRITPLPTREQLNHGATVSISGPQDAGIAMKLHTFSTQPTAKDYDPASLTAGIRQGNSAINQIAGVLAIALKKLDRVYFVGGGSGTVDINGQSVPLPRTDRKGDYPIGTPYFVPSDMNGATRIHLSNTPSMAAFGTPK